MLLAMKKLFLILSLLSGLACQSKIEAESDKGVVKVNFAGQMITYNDGRFSEGKLGSIESIVLNAGSTESDYLTLTLFGTKVGTYPYKQKIGDYNQVSQVDFQKGGKKYSNYFVKICPDKSGYYSSIGKIEISEYVSGKRIKGTFSGELMDAHSEDECEPSSRPFSGEFDIPVN